MIGNIRFKTDGQDLQLPDRATLEALEWADLLSLRIARCRVRDLMRGRVLIQHLKVLPVTLPYNVFSHTISRSAALRKVRERVAFPPQLLSSHK